MLNKSGFEVTRYGAVREIIAFGEPVGYGCVVSSNLGQDEKDGRKIAMAGTPLYIDFNDFSKPAVKPESGKAMNAVLLHDVDVTKGNANGTAVLFGFINLNRLDDRAVSLVQAAKTDENATPLITFLKV